jgi:hypothetical protein
MRRFVPFLLLLLSACTKPPAPTECQTSAQCAEACRCNSGVCTADVRPTASLRPLGAVEAFALVQLDGSASHDPDPGDAISEHAWVVRALEADCQAPEVTSRGPKPFVRFGCPGLFEVSLAVRDSLGLESATARQEVTVVPATGLSRVVAGPDLTTEHVCAGTPRTCVTERDIRLSANATPELSLRWSVLPPADRPLDSTRRVRFVPDASAAAPVAIIETEGTAISGDWVFVVEAYDSSGVVGAAHTRVSVGNRPPVVEFEPAGPFPHVFDPGRAVFLSSGTLAWSVLDPDGDPVDATATWRHVGDGGATFDGEVTHTAVSFVIQVPYVTPEDALRLRGGDGLSRRIELVVVDANGAEGANAAEIEIGNRPPVWTGGRVDASVPHRFDRAGSRYVATVRAGSFVDPDGDPIVGGAGAGPCGTAHVEGNDAWVECSVPFVGVPALDQLVGLRTFTVPVRDPWDGPASARVQTVQVLNSPPSVWGSPTPAAVPCRRLNDNATPLFTVNEIFFDVAPAVLDPDGDPVVITPFVLAGGTASPASALFTDTEATPFRFHQPARSSVSNPELPLSFLVASDGASSVKASVSPALLNGCY